MDISQQYQYRAESCVFRFAGAAETKENDGSVTHTFFKSACNDVSVHGSESDRRVEKNIGSKIDRRGKIRTGYLQ